MSGKSWNVDPISDLPTVKPLFCTNLNDMIFNLKIYLNGLVFSKHNSGRTTEDRTWLNGYVQEVQKPCFLHFYNLTYCYHCFTC